MMRKGFTVLEVLTVVAVVVGLSAIGVRAFTLIKRRGDQVACTNNLRGLGVALENYLQDHNGVMPCLATGRADRNSEDPVIEVVLLPYVDGDEEIFHCPADHELYAESGSSYFWNTTLNGQNRYNLKFLGETDRVDQVPLIYDKEAFHPTGIGANILYADYSVTDSVKFYIGQ